MHITYRYTLILAVAVMAFTACSQQSEKPAVDKKTQSETLIQEHFRNLNDHDLKAVVNQYAAKANITSSDWKGMATGPPGADQVFHLEFLVSPDAKYLVDKFINTDSTVVVEYDVVGLRDKLNGNVRYDVRKCSIFRIDGQNKISSEATYSNRAAYDSSQN